MDPAELSLEQEDYLTDPTNRIDAVADDILLLSDPDDMMLALLEVLTASTILPEEGRYYTFVYSPKTPRIEYDEYPLIACVGLFKWGFRGVNYHWGTFRNYTWEEVVGSMYLVYPNEVDIMRSIPYQKFRLNN